MVLLNWYLIVESIDCLVVVESNTVIKSSKVTLDDK